MPTMSLSKQVPTLHGAQRSDQSAELWVPAEQFLLANAREILHSFRCGTVPDIRFPCAMTVSGAESSDGRAQRLGK